MRQIMIRTSAATGEVMVVLVINGQSLPAEATLAQTLADEASASTVIINPHTARGNAVLGKHFRVIAGNGYIEESIGAVRYHISPQSFFQINSHQVKVLYDTAIQMAGDVNYFLDAHAGAGGITLYAAHHANNANVQALGVDIVAPAITDAQKNAALNGINHATFVTGAAEEVIPALLKDAAPDAQPQVVFLDPPRKGCETPLLDALIATRIPKIVYISCDPATLARDVKHLCAGGYTLVQVQPVDMFAHTGHVECVAELIFQPQ